MTTKPSTHLGKRVEQISDEFYARQRVTVRCAHCTDKRQNVHPDVAAAWFATHRQQKHPDLRPVKKRDRKITPNRWSNTQQFQSEGELAWREERRFIHTVGRT